MSIATIEEFDRTEPVPPTMRLAAKRGGIRLPAGWPIFVLFYGYPLWWALGLQAFIWPIMAVPMLFSLFMRRGIKVPRGFGIWLMFLGWMLISATQLTGGSRLLSYGYRAAFYISAGVIFLYAYNEIQRGAVRPRQFIFALVAMWWATVIGGYLGLIKPNFQFTSPTAMLLPHSITHNNLIQTLVYPGFGDKKILLGYASPRPKAPFNYTNEWGSNLAILTVVAMYATTLIRRRFWRNVTYAGLALSIVPIIVSINRGLWLSLGVGIIYVAARLAGRGRAKFFFGVVAILAVTLAVIVFTPLGHIVTDRFHHANTQGRSYLYGQATDSVMKSPLLGYGAPLPSQDLGLSADASVGTHGQMWTLLVSQGFPGAVLFVAFWVTMFFATWRVRTPALWLNAAILIMLVQLPYYNVLPVQMQTVAVVIVCAKTQMLPRASRKRLPKPVSPFLAESPPGVPELAVPG
jgi:O-antigen ligase